MPKLRCSTVPVTDADTAGDQPGQPGQRVFAVKLQGKTVAPALDIAAQTGGAQTAHIALFENIPVTETLLIELIPAQKDSPLPVLNALEILRTGEKEIKAGVAAR